MSGPRRIVDLTCKPAEVHVSCNHKNQRILKEALTGTSTERRAEMNETAAGARIRIQASRLVQLISILHFLYQRLRVHHTAVNPPLRVKLQTCWELLQGVCWIKATAEREDVIARKRVRGGTLRFC